LLKHLKRLNLSHHIFGLPTALGVLGATLLRRHFGTPLRPFPFDHQDPHKVAPGFAHAKPMPTSTEYANSAPFNDGKNGQFLTIHAPAA